MCVCVCVYVCIYMPLYNSLTFRELCVSPKFPDEPVIPAIITFIEQYVEDTVVSTLDVLTH